MWCRPLTVSHVVILDQGRRQGSGLRAQGSSKILEYGSKVLPEP